MHFPDLEVCCDWSTLKNIGMSSEKLYRNTLICIKILRILSLHFVTFENVRQTLKFGLVGCRVKFHPTDTAGEHLTKCHCSPVSVTKNHGNMISAYLWMFVETSREMYFTETSK